PLRASDRAGGRPHRRRRPRVRTRLFARLSGDARRGTRLSREAETGGGRGAARRMADRPPDDAKARQRGRARRASGSVTGEPLVLAAVVGAGAGGVLAILSSLRR